MGCIPSKPKYDPSIGTGFTSMPYNVTNAAEKPRYYNPHNGHTHQRSSIATWECVDRRAKGFKWSHHPKFQTPKAV
ncbi:hypothetical protein TARUN_4532 [Trichoderma arundinaceum]|uniref:Uncharacterized protein n=1 Tax=Trichoderma arundinaceum TaxID=490622 RepID=A0A395NNX4_TRIAR|nr:hypothetical protein TARUN_4532 [Trichoderma arundinaceum]